jgi:biopolymer transport protein ExbD
MQPNSTKHFDVWFVQSSTVYKQVPYHVVTDWVQQARLGAEDMLKPSGAPNWVKLSSLPLFEAYLPQPDVQKVGDAAEALEPIELDFTWKKRPDADDEDVDMIPLIDISLVLLIFFMMTTTVAAISRISVPTMENAVKIDTSREILRIDIDSVNGVPIYGLGKGTAAPDDADADLHGVDDLVNRLDAAIEKYQSAPKVRIAAHGDLPYEIVENVMKELDRRRMKGLIEEYHIEVNERAKR